MYIYIYIYMYMVTYMLEETSGVSSPHRNNENIIPIHVRKHVVFEVLPARSPTCVL
jgi:hypothetical protein